MRRLLLTCILMMAVLVSASGAFAETPIHECDRLAANPYDQQKVAPGIEWNAFEAALAIIACQKAVQQFPNVPRFQFQYGRALSKGKQYQDALKWYHLSAEQGYAAGQNGLGSG